MGWEKDGTGLSPYKKRTNNKEPLPQLSEFEKKVKAAATRCAVSSNPDSALHKKVGGAAARNKGKRGESEVARILQAVLDKAFLDAFVLLARRAAPDSDVEVLTMAARQKMLMLKANGGDNALRVLRNTMQAARGGCDLVGTPGISVEVKTFGKSGLVSWSRQTVTQATRHTVPVLWYKIDRLPWRCRIFVKDACDPAKFADLDYKAATEWLYKYWYEGTKRDAWGMLS